MYAYLHIDYQNTVYFSYIRLEYELRRDLELFIRPFSILSYARGYCWVTRIKEL